MSNKDIESMPKKSPVTEEKPLKREAPSVTDSPKDPSPKKRKQELSDGVLSKGKEGEVSDEKLVQKSKAEQESPENPEENKVESKQLESKKTDSQVIEARKLESKEESEETESKDSESKEQSEKADSKDSKPKEGKKYVFGSSTAFGQAPAFSVGTEKTSPSSSGSVFGSGSKFGDAFKNAVSRKSIFDQEPSKTPESKPETDTERESSSLYQAVDVERQELTTGEEEEQFLFSTRAKLYCLDATLVSQGWKERGVGVLRVNKLGSQDLKEKAYSARLVMRQDTTFKVILNIPVIPDFKPVKGLESSMAPEKFIRFNFVEEGKPVQFAIKTANKELANELYTVITDCM